MLGRPLEQRVALVTGANHGIGASTAVALAQLGAKVAISYLRLEVQDDDPARPAAYAEDRRQDGAAVVAEAHAAGSDAVAIEADLADPDAPARLFDEAEAALGPVSILVNNASGWRQDTFGGCSEDTIGRPNRPVTAETIDAQLLVDARGGALLIAELARRNRERQADWGRIVSLTSGGPAGFPGEVSYGAAKAALENYTMSASAELADLGITANVVHPPVTDTGWVNDAVREAVAADPSLRRIAQPRDVAEVIAWLCTDAARLVTGNIIRLR
jgi:3-oxoacyl-[acyl-carrier protein] reductase